MMHYRILLVFPVLVVILVWKYSTFYNKLKTISNNDTPNPAKIPKLDIIGLIRQDCGELCNTSRLGSEGPFFNHVTAPVNCVALFKNEYLDRTHGLTHAPKEIPQELLKYFTMGGRLKVRKWYFDQLYLGKRASLPVWTPENVNEMIKLASKGKLKGGYGVSATNDLRDGLKVAHGIRNGRVLVIGSQTPWVEACVLEAGAKEVITLEYGKIISKHPWIKTMTPSEFRTKYLTDTLGTFDGVVTYSSVEHSGLGRYGDVLNPWGDIIAVARAWCVTKFGGSLTVGVPYENNQDYITFNEARHYGKIRYPYLTTNWKQRYRGQGRQRVHVFTKEKNM